MKKVFLITLLTTIVALMATSCNKNDEPDWDLPSTYAYATVMMVDSESVSDTNDETDNTANSNIYFELDNGESLYVTENKSRYYLENLKSGTRVVIGIKIDKDNETGYDYAVTLYDVISVVIGTNEVVTTEAESDAIANDQLSYVANNLSLSWGYLNLFVGFKSEDIEDVKFYLVEDLTETTNTESDDYLSLELRFDNADSANDAPNFERYVSFDMSSYQTKLEGKEGILLSLKSVNSGTIEVKLSSENLFPSEE